MIHDLVALGPEHLDPVIDGHGMPIHLFLTAFDSGCGEEIPNLLV
jgi:hypothetical protein